MDVREFVEAFLLSLLRKVALPDVEFVINYRRDDVGWGAALRIL